MRAIVETFNLTKEFNGLIAVDNINFKIKKGEIFGLLGPNGAGKSTLVNMLCCLLKPTRGTARIAGIDILEEPEAVKSVIGVVPQEHCLYDNLTLYENLDFMAEMYEIPKEKRKLLIKQALDLMFLYERRNDPIGTFSGGMKQRSNIASGLINEPEILFLDEPTTGIDPQNRQAIWDFIRRLNQEEGVTIFITTHYMDEADLLCDRVAIMDHGKIIALDTPRELKGLLKGDIIEIESDIIDIDLIKSLEGVSEIIETKPAKIIVEDADSVLPDIIKNVPNIKSIRVEKPTLQDVFLKLTGRELRDRA
ncbi:MAG: ABC transporter ATP-binding protein [Candidatus Hydrothermarchaeota archaeon]